MFCITDEERAMLLSIIDESSLNTDEQRKSAMVVRRKLLKNRIESEEQRSCEKVVTLGKIVNVKTYFGQRVGLKIVLPEQADLVSRKLSIFSFIGAAIYGEKEGTVVPWMMDDELELVEITKVSAIS